MDKRTLLKGWCSIVLVHILFVLSGILPVVNYIKKTALCGFLINWAYQILLIVFIIVCLKDFLVDSWKRFISVGVKKNLKSIFLSFLACVGINIVFQVLLLVVKVDAGISQNQSAIRTYISAYPVLTGLLSIVVAAFTEECIYRGIIYHTIRKYSKIGAIVCSGLIFGLVHVISTLAKGNIGIAQILYLIINYSIGGICLAVVQERYNNIWNNYLVHVLWNAMGTLPAVIITMMK